MRMEILLVHRSSNRVVTTATATAIGIMDTDRDDMADGKKIDERAAATDGDKIGTVKRTKKDITMMGTTVGTRAMIKMVNGEEANRNVAVVDGEDRLSVDIFM